MNFKENLAIKSYSDTATKQFGDIEKRLSELDGSFQIRMDGKNTAGLVGSLIGTLVWLAVFIAAAVIASGYVDYRLLIAATIAVLALMAFMIIGAIMDFSYYGKIGTYRNQLGQLRNRVSMGKTAIKSNHDAFMAAQQKGWNFPLNAGTSIPEEANSIEATLASMESMKKGFINGAKTVFFYIAVIAVTIAGCVALYPAAESIMCGISSTDLSRETVLTLSMIALIVVGILEIVLAKLMFGVTDCKVTNLTLLIMAAAPVAFLLLILLGTLLVMLVVVVFRIVLGLVGVVIVGAIAYFCLSGG